MEYPHSVFMFKVKKFQSLIRYSIILWGGERQNVKVLEYKKVSFVQLNGCIKESFVGQFLKSWRFSQRLHYISLRCWSTQKSNMYLRRNSDIYEYNTRRKQDFHVPTCNTSLFNRSVINMGIRLYNKMPTRIKQLDSLRDFKRKLKLFLLDRPFYSLNEFIFEEDKRTNK